MTSECSFHIPQRQRVKIMESLADISEDECIEVTTYAALMDNKDREASPRVECQLKLTPAENGATFNMLENLEIEASVDCYISRVRYFSAPTGPEIWGEVTPHRETFVGAGELLVVTR